MPTGLPPSFGHAPGGLRRPLRDRRRPPSAILELHMDKTGRDGNSGLRRRQARCRAMRSSIRGDTPGADTRPPTHKECLLFPHASVSRAGRVRLQHSSTKPTPCAPPPLFGMPCSMASSRQQPGAVNRPFNTATHHTRYRATAFGLSIRSTGTTLRPVTPCAFEGHRARQGSAQTFGLSMITTPTLAGHPTGGFNGVSNARSSSRVHGPWHPSPAQAFGLVAAGSTVGQYGTPADYGGLATAERWRPSCLTAGALAHGGAPARVRSRVPLDGHFKRLS